VNHYHPHNFLIQSLRPAEEHLQALVGTVAKFVQKLAAVFDIDAQHDRDAEDKLPMRDGVKDVVGDVFPNKDWPSFSQGLCAHLPQGYTQQYPYRISLILQELGRRNAGKYSSQDPARLSGLQFHRECDNTDCQWDHPPD
jgi:hypothetical protein